MRRKIVGSFLISCICFSSMFQGQAYAREFVVGNLDVDDNDIVEENGAYSELLDEYVDAINEKDWKRYKKCFSLELEEQLNDFPTQEQTQERTGLLAVDKIAINDIKKISMDDAVRCEPRFENLEISEYDNIACYYVGFDYDVKQEYENEFYYDGTKYSFIIVGENENGKDILGMEDAYYYDVIEDVGVAFDNEDERKAIKVIDNRNNGVITNFSGEVLRNETKFEKVNVLKDEVLNEYNASKTYVSEPEIIKVVVNGSVKSMSLNNYTANVLPNEWYMSWNESSLKAGAVTIRMFGWYNVLHPRTPATTYGAHVTDTTEYQRYVDGSATTKSLLMVQHTETVAMLNSSNSIFEPQYRAGYSGMTTSGKNSGVMYQWGTKYLGEQNYSYKNICSFYFSYSSLCAGEISWATIR